MFDPFAGLHGDWHDFAINMAAELVGAVLSIGISIFFANWLDRRAEQRKYRRRLASCSRKIGELLEFLTGTVFVEPKFDPAVTQPPLIALRLVRDYDALQGLLVKHIESVDLDFNDHVEDDVYRDLSRARSLAINLHACFGLRSHALHERAGRGAPLEEIVQHHTQWAVSNIVELLALTDKLNETCGIRPERALDRGEEALQAGYRKLFEAVVPYAVERIAKDRPGS